ncbi:unnamed protein product [Hymenolepis diminuta]|uniref:Gag protease polyprotein-like protein n=1 Tax=Hymenolepis diminuta TaxID=6216 RepID=A0A0R3SWF4_HYMDI|nr:unnamed protein product [Hymenolepis diminuta]
MNQTSPEFQMRRRNPLVAPFRVSSASGDVVQLSRTMKCEATFKEKIAAIVCYVADRDINLLGLDWIDMFNVLEPKVQSATCPQVQMKEKEDFGQADSLSPLIENQRSEKEEIAVASVSTRPRRPTSDLPKKGDIRRNDNYFPPSQCFFYE